MDKKNTTSNSSILSHNIRFLRKKYKLSQEGLANKVGIKRSNIAAYESKNVEPRLRIILELSKIFDINVQDLLEVKLTKDKEYQHYAPEQSIQVEAVPNNILNLDNKQKIQEFVDKSMKIRKVLEGFKAFYHFKKERIKKEESVKTNRDKLIFDIDNFLQLMEHLLNYNETVIKTLVSSESSKVK